jgi:hypothetical protein
VPGLKAVAVNVALLVAIFTWFVGDSNTVTPATALVMLPDELVITTA